MSDFPLAGQPVTHPSWCDPAYCTAPATYPMASERDRSGEHRSAPLGEDGAVFEGDQVYLSQSACVPWKCETYLNIRASDGRGGDRRMSIQVDYTSPLMWAVLAQADDLYREYPTLMQAEGVKRSSPWRPLSAADALPEPRETAPHVDVPTVDVRKPTEIVDEPPKWWCVIYTSVSDRKTYISIPFRAPTLEDAFALTAQSLLVQDVVNGVGPFESVEEAVSYRTAWIHGGELAAIQARVVANFAAKQADAIIEDWVPKAVAPLPTPQRLWAHSGPCIYCSHGPACVTCDLTQGPYWGKGSPGHEHPGPVCTYCSAECKRREIAADPYYSGDYMTMFGDDE